MPNPQSKSPLPSGSSELGTSECPHVADLIDYALGKAAGEARREVEAHLHGCECSWCRSWIQHASRFRPEPWLDENKLTANPLLSSSSSPSSHPSPDRTPIPENSKWQRQAFPDLEKRLRLLEES